MNKVVSEYIGQRINSLLKRFPIKAKSLDDFIDILERKKATYVEGRLYVVRDPIDKWNKEVTQDHDCIDSYSALFYSQTLFGRPIIFEEPYKIKYASKYEPEGIKDDIYLRLMVTIDDRIKIVKKKLPSIKTTIFGTKAQLDAYANNQILSDAEKQGILPWPLQKLDYIC